MKKPRNRVLALFGLFLTVGCVAQPTQQAALSHPPYRADVVSQWVQLDWPKHDGCAATAVNETLPPGTQIDRFGNEYGSFFSPKGESFGSRALPYVCSETAYHVYRVTRPLPVSACKTAPWFDEPGGATQYKTAEPASALREAGVIEPVSAVAGDDQCRSASMH